MALALGVCAWGLNFLNISYNINITSFIVKFLYEDLLMPDDTDRISRSKREQYGAQRSSTTAKAFWLPDETSSATSP